MIYLVSDVRVDSIQDIFVFEAVQWGELALPTKFKTLLIFIKMAEISNKPGIYWHKIHQIHRLLFGLKV